jgi:hypothetical protein
MACARGASALVAMPARCACRVSTRLPLFACTTMGISALMLGANLVVGLSTSSACHLVDCSVVVILVVVFAFRSMAIAGRCELTCVSCLLESRPAHESIVFAYRCVE